MLCFTAGRTDEVVIWHQSKTEPPNLRVAAAGGAAGGSDQSQGGQRRLTDWPDPHPALTGLEKRVLQTERADGVQLSGMLYLPPGYDQARDGSLPLVIWAYPNDYGSAGTAGQIRVTSTRFTRLTSGDPIWFVMRGYAVLNNATMPVIGDPETKNDTFLEQVTAAAAAHIEALTSIGIADPARVAVGGHSYGAFMTANLLAHTDLFAAGIARSGAYNRTLTPFGFQRERRSFWEVPAGLRPGVTVQVRRQDHRADPARARRRRRQLRHVPGPVRAAVPGHPGHRRYRQAGDLAAREPRLPRQGVRPARAFRAVRLARALAREPLVGVAASEG